MRNDPQAIHSVSNSLLINALPRQVFEAVADPRKPFLTSNPFTHLEVVSGQRPGKETIYHWRFTLPFGIRFQLHEVVSEWIEPEHFSDRAISGWKVEATNQITPENGQTLNTFRLRYQIPGIWNRLIPTLISAVGYQPAHQNIKRGVEPPKRKSKPINI